MLTLIKNFIIWLVVLLIIFVVYSVCLGRIYANKDLQKAAKFYPGYSEVLFKTNEQLLTNWSERNTQEIEINSIRALHQAPMSFKPFLHLARMRNFQKRRDEARRLFSEVKSRNIRSRRALVALLDLDIYDNNLKGVIENLDILLGLNAKEENKELYHKLLTEVSFSPEARIELDKLLEIRPPWGPKYLFNQIEVMTEENFLEIGTSLKIYTQAENKRNVDDVLNATYLKKLTRMKKINEAHNYWKLLSESVTNNEPEFLYNSQFEKTRALPPFNWSEIAKAEYFSEIDEEGGLYASYRDRDDRTLTEQVLILNPGDIYKLEIEAEWSYRQRQGQFFWIITCLQSSTVISRIDLNDDAKSLSGGEHTFQVPVEGCTYQNIRLVAKTGEYSKRIWSRTNSIKLDRVQ